MAKKDFMSELAREVEDKKAGKKGRIMDVTDFQPNRKPVESDNSDEEEIQIRPVVSSTPIEEPSSVNEEPEEEYEEPEEEDEEIEEPQPVKPAVFKTPEPEEDDETPDSFREEERIKVETPKRELKPIAKILLGILVLLIAFLIYWFGFAGHIVVKNFVGQDVGVVSTWAKQNKMDAGVVATSEEYSLEYAKGVVIDQSVAAGKKVRKSTPITITVSKGPNPDEQVSFPDINSMTFSEIQDWIKENGLLKTKVTQTYSETVPNGEVINYQLKNADEASFKRGDTLNITCSKGPQPAEQITIVDFTGKAVSEAETWAKSKKITLNTVQQYSEKIESGFIISQDKKSGENLKSGDTLTVIVSKGKGVTIPNLVGYTAEQLEAWQAGKNNNVTLIRQSKYDWALEGTVIGQSLPAGSVVDSGEVLMLTVSAYMPQLETSSRQWLGVDYLQLKKWVDDTNAKGANIQAGTYNSDYFNANAECSDDYPTPGQIIDYACIVGSNHPEADGCARPLDLNARIAYKVSSGPCKAAPTPGPITDKIIMTNGDIATLQSAISFFDGKGMKVTVDNDPYSTNPSDPDVKVVVNGTEFTSSMSFQTLVDPGATVQIRWKQNTTAPTPEPTPEPTPAP